MKLTRLLARAAPIMGLPLFMLAACTGPAEQQVDTSPSTAASDAPWVSDLGDGTYKNPVLYADYSDPDAVRVGDTFYMTSSSFNSAPGLPLLKSKDLVNWELVGHALEKLVPREHFAIPRHGNGIWAPCLRYHNGKFWIFYPDPDFGIYVTTAEDFGGPWTEPHLLLPGKGLIDPSPLWDDDGKAYLIHAWAKSRAGFNNVLTLHEMTPDAKRVLDDGEIVVDGHKLEGYRTLEGPKFYKRNGYYYIFAPSGGVEFGDQSVFRSKNIWGPYEDRIVLSQGDSPINGPHQGAWVTTQSGQHWFLHFQQKGVYGRIVHLEPMIWKDGWPVMGTNVAANGTLPVGEPVLRHAKPDVSGQHPVKAPPSTDYFSADELGVQWQWNANWERDWYSLTERPGHLRLHAQYDPAYADKQNMWLTPFLLFQKVPAPAFSVETRLEFDPEEQGDRAGLLVYGYNYGWLGLRQGEEGLELAYVTCYGTREGCQEETRWSKPVDDQEVDLRLRFREGGDVTFAYSLDGDQYLSLDHELQAESGHWVGGKIGLFAAKGSRDSTASADFDRFVVSPL